MNPDTNETSSLRELDKKDGLLFHEVESHLPQSDHLLLNLSHATSQRTRCDVIFVMWRRVGATYQTLAGGMRVGLVTWGVCWSSWRSGTEP